MPRNQSPSFLKNSLYGLLVVVVFFGLLEGVLFLLGVTPLQHVDDIYVGFAAGNPLFVADRTPARSGWMVTAENKRLHFNLQSFPKEKKPGSQRVFCLGGSTTYGRPYGDSTSFCGWLREYLPAVSPSSTWEVINAGGISYASYRVAQLTLELVKYQPDLFVVYSGHNEFLEERTYGALKRMPGVLRELSALLDRTRTYTGIRRLLQGSRNRGREDGQPSFQMKPEVETVLDNSIGPSSYHRDDGLSASVLQHYRHSLQRIADVAFNAGVRVIFVNTPSNLKDCSPFKSEHSPTVNSSERRRFRDLFQKANLHFDQGDYQTALEIYQEAHEIDTRFSHLLYQMGRTLLKLDRYEEAREYLIRAKDEDVCPLRALSPMLDIVREASLQKRVPFIDWNRILEARSEEEKGHRILGEEEFLDHVHLTIESHRLLALEIISAMAAETSFGIPKDWRDVDLSQITQARMESVDTTAHAGALHNLAKVYNWAGKHEDAVNVALKGLALDSTHEEAVTSFIMVGTSLHRQGKLKEALPYYQSALDMDANNYEANKFAGMIYSEWEENEKALSHFLLALDTKPDDQETRYEVGLSYLRLKRPAEALEHFSYLVERFPQSHKFRYGLGLALYRNGMIQAAEREWNHILRLDPKHRGALKGLEMIRTGERRDGSKRRSGS